MHVAYSRRGRPDSNKPPNSSQGLGAQASEGELRLAAASSPPGDSAAVAGAFGLLPAGGQAGPAGQARPSACWRCALTHPKWDPFNISFFRLCLAAGAKRPRPSGLATAMSSAACPAGTHCDTHQLAHSPLQRPFSARHK